MLASMIGDTTGTTVKKALVEQLAIVDKPAEEPRPLPRGRGAVPSAEPRAPSRNLTRHEELFAKLGKHEREDSEREQLLELEMDGRSSPQK